MNALLQDFRRIWNVTTIQRDERSMMVMNWFALAAGSLGAVGAGMIVLARQDTLLLLPRVLAGVGAFWLGYIWMALFVPASIVLNSPANARLVPRQRRRLVQMAGASWLLITAALSFAIGDWGAIPAVGLALIGFALLRAGKHMAGFLFVAAINWPTLSKRVLPPAVVAAILSPAGLLLLTVLMLALGAWALRTLYPAGGDFHLAHRDDQVKRAGRNGRWDWSNQEHTSRLAAWTQARVYAAALRRDGVRPQAGPMLMHALGPVAHWSAWLGGMGIVLALAGGARLLIAWRGAGFLQRYLDGMLSVGLGTLAVMVAFGTAAYGQQLRRTAGEQALLRLTPLAGGSMLLNRRLAAELCRGALRTWAMLTSVVLLATLLVGAGPDVVLREAALCMLAGQLAAIGLLGDFADDGGWTARLGLLAGLAGGVECLAALALGAVSGVAVWWWLMAIALGACAWQLRRAWRIMLAAPPAFPAGRLQ